MQLGGKVGGLGLWLVGWMVDPESYWIHLAGGCCPDWLGLCDSHAMFRFVRTLFVGRVNDLWFSFRCWGVGFAAVFGRSCHRPFGWGTCEGRALGIIAGLLTTKLEIDNLLGPFCYSEGLPDEAVNSFAL